MSAGEAHDVLTPEAASAGLLRHLNPEQLAAVTLPAKPALILAVINFKFSGVYPCRNCPRTAAGTQFCGQVGADLGCGCAI